MAAATWNGALLAESDTFETGEGNICFPIPNRLQPILNSLWPSGRE